VNSEIMPYIMGGCVCLSLLVVVAGAVGGLLLARNRGKSAASAAVPESAEPVPAPSQPAVSATLSETAITPPVPESAPLADTMASDLNATAVSKPVDDFTSDLKATLVHRQAKKEETDDDASAV
jgi:hypothetical protein